MMEWVIPDNELNLRGRLHRLVQEVEALSLGRRDIALKLHALADSIVEKEEKENE